MVTQQTHWQDCYKYRHHHACALVEIDRLRAENESLRKVFDAAENLVKVKGRFHSEQAYGRLVTAVAGMKVEE